jgi:hypothetical protein
MFSIRTIPTIIAFTLASSALVGCAPSGQQAADATTRRDIDRETAIANARQDAWSTYRELAVAQVVAQRLGAFWIIELRSVTGGGVRYAISSPDGTNRQRSTIQ